LVTSRLKGKKKKGGRFRQPDPHKLGDWAKKAPKVVKKVLVGGGKRGPAGSKMGPGEARGVQTPGGFLG